MDDVEGSSQCFAHSEQHGGWEAIWVPVQQIGAREAGDQLHGDGLPKANMIDVSRWLSVVREAGSWATPPQQ